VIFNRKRGSSEKGDCDGVEENGVSHTGGKGVLTGVPRWVVEIGNRIGIERKPWENIGEAK